MSGFKIYKLDLELLAEILSYRSAKDILDFCLASKNIYNQVCNRKEFWQRVYLLKRHRDAQDLMKIIPKGSWKDNVLALSIDFRLGPGSTYIDFDHPIYQLLNRVKDQEYEINIFYVYLDPQDLNKRLEIYYESINTKIDKAYFNETDPILFTLLGRVPNLEINPYDDVDFLLLSQTENILKVSTQISEQSESFYEKFTTPMLFQWIEDGFPIDYEYYPIYYQDHREFALSFSNMSDELKSSNFLFSDKLTYVITTEQYDNYLLHMNLVNYALSV